MTGNANSTPTSNDSQSGTVFFSVVNAITLGLPIVPLFLKQLAYASEFIGKTTESKFFRSTGENLHKISDSGLSSWSLVRDCFGSDHLSDHGLERSSSSVVSNDGSNYKEDNASYVEKMLEELGKQKEYVFKGPKSEQETQQKSIDAIKFKIFELKEEALKRLEENKISNLRNIISKLYEDESEEDSEAKLYEDEIETMFKVFEQPKEESSEVIEKIEAKLPLTRTTAINVDSLTNGNRGVMLPNSQYKS
ncbi:MAG: hypothetical protein EBS06_04335 [Proteobacteria bacterium]|nr:hypothetical protein [Pseudomonadota bacterium]